MRTGTQRSDGGKTSAARVIARGWHRNRTRHLSCRVDPSFCDATPTGGGDDDEREQPEECAETRVAVASTGNVRRRYEATRFASFTAATSRVTVLTEISRQPRQRGAARIDAGAADSA